MVIIKNVLNPKERVIIFFRVTKLELQITIHNQFQS